MKKFIVIILVPILFFLSGKLSAQVQYQNTTNNNTNSSAIGYGTVASGEKSFASGINSTAEGICSTTLGQFNYAKGHYAITIGCNLEADEMRSMIIGSGYSDYFMLKNNMMNSLMIGFESQYPTLFIGSSPDYNKTGRIGIGNVTNPQAKLHIKADEWENASLFLEPTVWNDISKPEIMMGDSLHGISAEIGNGMVYQTEEYHSFRGGDIYIEDISKGVIMKSPDGKCWRGTLNNDGELHFSVMEACPGVTTAIPENKNSGTEIKLKVFPNPTDTFLTVELKNANNELCTIKLLDEKGTEVKMDRTTGNTTRFYTADLASGTYIIQVITGDKMLTKKIVKQ